MNAPSRDVIVLIFAASPGIAINSLKGDQKMQFSERMPRKRSTSNARRSQRSIVCKPDLETLAGMDSFAVRLGEDTSAKESITKCTLPPETQTQKSATSFPAMLTPKEAANRLKLSTSWVAKARMRGDGPPYIRIGRSIRYSEAALLQWMKSRQRLSTSEQ
jgi:predicted DNA-binding transcriptional regulator AlpA